jgi:hypothetical protein
MDATGQCLCGAVRFTAKDVHEDFHACRCETCRRWGGGPAFATETGGVTFEDDGALVRYPSSEWAERGFCARCGAHLFYFLKPTGQYMVWVGALDDPSPFRLTGEIFVDDPQAQFAFAGDHPRLTGAEALAAMGFEAPDPD